MNEFVFVIEVLIAGLLSGVMYSLVALGFVLIFKASGVFNFAQGAMVLFAALTFARFLEMGINFWLAAAIALVVMMVMAVVIERVMLRPLVAQPVIILFMATIGLNYFLEGMAQAVWDSQVHALELGIEDVPMGIGHGRDRHTDQPVRCLGSRYLWRIGVGARLFLSERTHWPRAQSGSGRQPGGNVGRHSPADDLGHRVGDCWNSCVGRWRIVGATTRRSIQYFLGRTEGLAGIDSRWV